MSATVTQELDKKSFSSDISYNVTYYHLNVSSCHAFNVICKSDVKFIQLGHQTV